jgi:hypothetical protein
VRGHGPVKIVNFEKYFLSFCLERSKVVFLARVVDVTKIVEDRDGFDDALKPSAPQQKRAYLISYLARGNWPPSPMRTA